jgi:hypothetical protein
MSTGELLDRTFAMYRRNFWLFIGIGLPFPALSFLQRIYEAFALTPLVHGMARTLVYRRLAWEGLSMVLGSLFCLSITHAATLRAVSALHLSRQISVRESYRALKGRVAQVIGIAFCQIALACVGVLVAVAAIFIVMIILVVVAIALGTKPGALAGRFAFAIGSIAILACAVGACLAIARFALAEQACIIEGKRVIASLKRSFFLSRKSFWRIALVYMLFLSFGVSVTFSAQVAVKYATIPFDAVRLTSGLQAITGFCVGALLAPFGTVAMSLLYYDERVRKEAFDLQILIETLDGPADGSLAATAV